MELSIATLDHASRSRLGIEPVQGGGLRGSGSDPEPLVRGAQHRPPLERYWSQKRCGAAGKLSKARSTTAPQRAQLAPTSGATLKSAAARGREEKKREPLASLQPPPLEAAHAVIGWPMLSKKEEGCARGRRGGGLLSSCGSGAVDEAA